MSSVLKPCLKKLWIVGCRHSSVDSSAPSILPPRFESQAHHLSFYQFKLICHVEKTKINKQRPGLAIFKKEIMTRWLGFKPRISGFKSIVGRHYGIMPPGFFLPPPRPPSNQSWFNRGSPMLMDPHHSHQHAGLRNVHYLGLVPHCLPR